MRSRVVGSLQAVAVIVATSGVGCSLTDLDGLSQGSGGGGTGTTTGLSSVGSTSGGSTGTEGSSTTTSSGDVGATTTGASTGGGGDASSGSTGGGGEGGAPPCLDGQICALVDDFTRGSADRWGAFGVCARSDAGALVVDALDVAQAGSYCGFYTLDVYDFRGGSVTVAVDEVTRDGFGVQTFVNVNNAAEDATVGLVVQDGMLTFADRYITEYDPVAQRFWRIAERDGDMVLSVHPADLAGAWVELLVIEDHAITLESVRIAVGVGTFADVAAPGKGVFDCVNVPLEDCPLP